MRRPVHFPALLLALGLSPAFALGQTQFAELARQHLPNDSDGTYSVALGDVDGDGDLDLMCGNLGPFVSGQQNRLYLNDGRGRFTDATTSNLPSVSNETRAIALGDVDGDGDLDLICGNSSGFSRQNRLYLNDGKGKFTDATASKLPALRDATEAVTLGDVDGDGDLDLIFGNRNSQNKLYLNDGKGKFTDATASKLPKETDGTYSVALGDVDGDRDLDLICGNVFSGRNKLYLNDGKGSFTVTPASRLPNSTASTFSLALGDVDGDGDLDVVFGSGGASQNRLYLNNGKGSFTDATMSKFPKDGDFTVSITLGDVDGDGDLDLISGNQAVNRLYLNDGKGGFTDTTASRLPKDSDRTFSVALGDVDGDGDLDLISGNVGSRGQQNRIYLNLHRQVHAPVPARIGNPYTLDFYAKPGYGKTLHGLLAVW